MVSKKNAKGEDTEDEQTRLFGFRTAYIFDIADTEGEAIPASRSSPATHGTTPNG